MINNEAVNEEAEEKLELERLAERIYDLDEKVYITLESALGRVFGQGKEESVREMMETMRCRHNAHFMRTEMALIGNMARTIPEPEKRQPLLEEYYQIMEEIEKLPESFETVDILSKKIAKTNTIGLKKRFKDKDHLIICISRPYGCMGSTIGFNLAEKLNINYYDVEIFNMTTERMQVDPGEVRDQADYPYQIMPQGEQRLRYKDLPYGEKKGFSIRESLHNFNVYHGLPKDDAVFFNQSELILELAKKEDFVVMGRCAEVVLTNKHIPHISIFITAPMEQRVRHIMKVAPELTEKKARHILKEQDAKHVKYYKYFTGRNWGSATNYDLCINSAAYGMEGSLDMIMRILPEQLVKRHAGELEASGKEEM